MKLDTRDVRDSIVQFTLSSPCMIAKEKSSQRKTDKKVSQTVDLGMLYAQNLSKLSSERRSSAKEKALAKLKEKKQAAQEKSIVTEEKICQVVQLKSFEPNLKQISNDDLVAAKDQAVASFADKHDFSKVNPAYVKETVNQVAQLGVLYAQNLDQLGNERRLSAKEKALAKLKEKQQAAQEKSIATEEKVCQAVQLESINVQNSSPAVVKKHALVQPDTKQFAQEANVSEEKVNQVAKLGSLYVKNLTQISKNRRAQAKEEALARLEQKEQSKKEKSMSVAITNEEILAIVTKYLFVSKF